MLERKINAKILSFPTSTVCHRQKMLAFRGTSWTHTVLDNDTMLLLSSILPIQPDTDVPLSGPSNQCPYIFGKLCFSQVQGSGPPSHEQLPWFSLIKHIKAHRLMGRQVPRNTKDLKESLKTNKKPPEQLHPKPRRFCSRFEMQCVELEPAFQPSKC